MVQIVKRLKRGWRNLGEKHSGHIVASMEVVNQFCARKTYDRLLHKIGVDAIHKKDIIQSGFGYNREVSNLLSILRKYKIDEDAFLNHFQNRIRVNDYEMIHDNLIKFLRGYKVPNSENLVKGLILDSEEFSNLLMGGK